MRNEKLPEGTIEKLQYDYIDMTMANCRRRREAPPQAVLITRNPMGLPGECGWVAVLLELLLLVQDLLGASWHNVGPRKGGSLEGLI